MCDTDDLRPTRSTAFRVIDEHRSIVHIFPTMREAQKKVREIGGDTWITSMYSPSADVLRLERELAAEKKLRGPLHDKAWYTEEMEKIVAERDEARRELAEKDDLIELMTKANADTEDARLDAERRLSNTQSAWIPVSERLPEPDVWVLGVEGDKVERVAYGGKDWWHDREFISWDITRWMPLPEAK